MVSIRLICVGKLKEKFYREACAEYEKRLKGYCKLEVIELPERDTLAKEAELIRNKILSGSMVIAMCIEGELLSSEQLSAKLNGWMGNGISQISIIIGGSTGLDEAVKQLANLRLSMSRMTFPHHLARVMVLEQVYRACNIAAGGKYHK